MNVWHVVAGVVAVVVVSRLIRKQTPLEQAQGEASTNSTNEGQAQINMGASYVGLAPSSGQQGYNDNPLQGLTRGLGDFVGGRLFDLARTIDPSNPNSPLRRRANQAGSVLRPEDRVPERVFYAVPDDAEY